jgi:hypothetical protein
MKIALGLAAIILLAAAPAHGQARGGATRTNSTGTGSFGGTGLTGTTNFTTLTWSAPATLGATTVSGTSDFTPSTFVTFTQAIAQGNAAIKEQSKTVVEAAAESRKTANSQSKVVLMQDNNGNVVYTRN